MRKILIILLFVIVALSILWIVAGRQVSEFADRFKLPDITSNAARSISYKGTGEGGELVIDVVPSHVSVSLAPLNPHVGTNKDNQLALANAGKVFAFGPVRSADGQILATKVPSGDTALVKQSHSSLPWLDVAELRANHFLALRQHWYIRLVWTKASGATLKMLWRSKGDGDPRLWLNGSLDDSTLKPAPEITGLIRVEISGASR